MHVNRLRSLLVPSELRRGMVVLVGAAAIAQVIVVVSSPVITRLYSPSELGAYAVALSMLSVLTTVACLRYEWAVPLPGEDRSAASVLALCLVITAGMGLLALIVLVPLGPSVLGIFGVSIVGPFAVLVALGQVGGGFVLAFTSWAIRTRAFAEIAANRLTQSSALIATQIGLGLAHLGATGLLVGAVVGCVAGSTRLAHAAWRTHASAFRQVTRADIWRAAGRYRRFPAFSAPSALLNALGLEAPLLLLTALLGTAVGGEYALAQRVVALPVTLLSGAVVQVFVAESARLVRENPAGVRSLFVHTTQVLAVMSLVPFGLLAILAPLLAGPVFGDSWREAGLFVTILTPMYYLQLLASSTGGTLEVLERQDLEFVREMMRLCFYCAAALVAATMYPSPIGTVGVLSIAGCLTYSFYGLTSWHAVVHHHERLPGGPGLEMCPEPASEQAASVVEAQATDAARRPG